MPQSQYIPTRVSPPGETLSELLEERGLSQKELSLKLGRSDKNLSQIVNGRAPITPDLALDLERVLGTPAHFWNNREMRYREWLSRQAVPEPTDADLEWARGFCYSKMAALQWVAPAASAREKFFNLLRFFGVVDRPAFLAWQGSLSPQYRRSAASTGKDDLIAAWLRRGEIQATSLSTPEYSEQAFSLAVRKARSLTLEPVEVFVPKLYDTFAKAGVVLLFVPELPGMGVSGATRWLGSKAVIQITLRYKTNDHLWFTIFHESCHILKHQKRAVFLEYSGNESVEEAEANQFAADLLIPQGEFRKFVSEGAFDSKSVLALSKQIGICPGVVVGRLQREGLIGWHSLNGLKQTFKWSQE